MDFQLKDMIHQFITEQNLAMIERDPK